MSAPGSGATHTLTEYGTTNCPVESVRANVDDGECSACGAQVAGLGASPSRDDDGYFEVSVDPSTGRLSSRPAVPARDDDTRLAEIAARAEAAIRLYRDGADFGSAAAVQLARDVLSTLAEVERLRVERDHAQMVGASLYWDTVAEMRRAEDDLVAAVAALNRVRALCDEPLMRRHDESGDTCMDLSFVGRVRAAADVPEAPQ